MAAYEIPLVQGPQVFTVQIGQADYTIRLVYASTDEGGWIMDISDANGAVLAAGLPLVTGSDLLGQLAYLGISGALYAATDGAQDIPPTFGNLGVSGRLYVLQ